MPILRDWNYLTSHLFHFVITTNFLILSLVFLVELKVPDHPFVIDFATTNVSYKV
jgi:hypothetical protein